MGSYVHRVCVLGMHRQHSLVRLPICLYVCASAATVLPSLLNHSLCLSKSSTQQLPSLSQLWLTSKDKEEDDYELIHGMAQDVLHHSSGDQGLVSPIGVAPQQRIGWGLCGQGQGSKRVHDQVNPQHLHCFQWGILGGRRRTRTFSLLQKPSPRHSPGTSFC